MFFWWQIISKDYGRKLNVVKNDVPDLLVPLRFGYGRTVNWPRAAGDFRKILPYPRLGLGVVKVAGDGEHRVIRYVIGVIKRHKFIKRRGTQMVHRTDDRPMIRVLLVCTFERFL